jgi:tryptophan synthase alpha chain
VAVGFGIRDGQRAAAIAAVADAAVVGTALVERVAEAQMKKIDPAEHVLELVRELSTAIRGVAKAAA